jgi:hypothetical protein
VRGISPTQGQTIWGNSGVSAQHKAKLYGATAGYQLNTRPNYMGQQRGISPTQGQTIWGNSGVSAQHKAKLYGATAGYQPNTKPNYMGQQTHKMQTNIHASRRIQTCDSQYFSGHYSAVTVICIFRLSHAQLFPFFSRKTAEDRNIYIYIYIYIYI